VRECRRGPKDSQTVPAKFSERNAAPRQSCQSWHSVGLTDVQRKIILDERRATKAPLEQRDAKVSEALPATLEASEFSQTISPKCGPDQSEIRSTGDKVLLIVPANHIVVDQIKN